MVERNTVTAMIFGSEYTIVGTESKEYIEKVCKTVDENMLAFSGGALSNPIRTAVLCSVNMCDEIFKAQEELETLKSELAELKNQMNTLSTKNRVLTEENNYLKLNMKSSKYPGDRR